MLEILLSFSKPVIAIFLGIGLSASAGFRVFLPLFMLSLAVNLGFIPINETWSWVGDKSALTMLGIATLIEIIAYFIPFVDNLLDTISIPLAGVAGTLLMASTLVGLEPFISWTLAIIAGGGTAIAIKGASSSTRLLSSATTLGAGNFLVTFLETLASGFMGIMAIFLPIVGVFLVFLILYFLYRFFNKKTIVQ